MIKYYHFTSKEKINIDILKEIISSSYHSEYQISYDDFSYTGYIEANEDLYDSLINFQPLLQNDLGVSITFMISHENSKISKYALSIAQGQFTSKITTLSDIYLYTISNGDNTINNELNIVFKDINYDLMQTGLTFVHSGLNACLAAKRLYIHRNTFNYRLNKFIDYTNLDIRDFDNALLFYLYTKNNN